MDARLPLVLMASVLNPKDHPRIWHREAGSLIASGYRVEILAGSTPFRKDIGFRLWQQFRFIQKVIALKPGILHLHTPELAWTAFVLKAIYGFKLVYDRHENYPLQIQHDTSRPVWMNAILSRLIKRTEKALFRRADLILLAEPGYTTDAPEDAILIRNSFLPLKEMPVPAEAGDYFLICGALSEKNGIKEACEFWQDLRRYLPLPLQVCGHSQEGSLTRYLYKLRDQYPNEVILEGIEFPLPYARIQEKIAHCRCGLSLFQESLHLKGKIPSRFFEFIGFQKPLFISGNEEWARAAFPPNIRYMPSGKWEAEACAAWLNSALILDYSIQPWSWKEDEEKLLQAYRNI
jgi:hypothetical protein